MHKKRLIRCYEVMLLAGILAGDMCVSTLRAQTSVAVAKTMQTGNQKRYHPSRFPKRAGEYYRLVWGVDLLSVKAMESGKLIRFNYHVVDEDKAKPLSNKDVEALLNSPEHGVQLVVPSLEKVGKLRQTSTPDPGRSYWMAFSNPRRVVKRGDRVNIVIGQFHADALVVE